MTIVSSLALVSFASVAASPTGWMNATNFEESTDFDGVVRGAGGRWDAFLKPPFVSSHNSMVEQTQDGRLHMTYLSGPKEGTEGWDVVYTYLDSSKLQKGSVWSEAKVISQRSGYAMGGASVYADADTLHVFHAQRLADKGETGATVWHLSSKLDSNGIAKGFSDATEIVKTVGTYSKNRLVELLDGSHLLPVYFTGEKPNYPKTELLPAGKNYDQPSAWSSGSFASGKGCENLVQPTVVRPRGNYPKLIVFFRDRLKRNIYRAMSRTDGQTWTPCEPTDLSNNNAGIQAWALRSRRIALVYNPTNSGRDTLAISLSEDQGVTWKYTRVLEKSTAINGAEFSYPSVREDRFEDGVLHVSYTYLRQTIKYSRITEDWVMKAGDEAVV